MRSSRNGVMGKAGLVAGAGVTVALLLGTTAPRVAWLLVAGASSALLLAGLERMRGRMTPLALRAAADVVLLTPAFLLMLWR